MHKRIEERKPKQRTHLVPVETQPHGWHHNGVMVRMKPLNTLAFHCHQQCVCQFVEFGNVVQIAPVKYSATQ